MSTFANKVSYAKAPAQRCKWRERPLKRSFAASTAETESTIPAWDVPSPARAKGTGRTTRGARRVPVEDDQTESAPAAGATDQSREKSHSKAPPASLPVAASRTAPFAWDAPSPQAKRKRLGPSAAAAGSGTEAIAAGRSTRSDMSVVPRNQCEASLSAPVPLSGVAEPAAVPPSAHSQASLPAASAPLPSLTAETQVATGASTVAVSNTASLDAAHAARRLLQALVAPLARAIDAAADGEAASERSVRSALRGVGVDSELLPFLVPRFCTASLTSEPLDSALLSLLLSRPAAFCAPAAPPAPAVLPTPATLTVTAVDALPSPHTASESMAVVDTTPSSVSHVTVAVVDLLDCSEKIMSASPLPPDTPAFSAPAVSLGASGGCPSGCMGLASTAQNAGLRGNSLASHTVSLLDTPVPLLVANVQSSQALSTVKSRNGATSNRKATNGAKRRQVPVVWTISKDVSMSDSEEENEPLEQLLVKAPIVKAAATVMQSSPDAASIEAGEEDSKRGVAWVV